MLYPVFPLNIVVLPEESVALHLFEPRYRQLFKDVRNGEDFVILFQESGNRSGFGTVVFIEKIINEYPDETVDLIVRGKKLFRIRSFLDRFKGKLYSGVEGDPVTIENKVGDVLKTEFLHFLEIVGKKHNSQSELSLFKIANRLELSQKKKDDLIHCPNHQTMNRFLINEIRFYEKILEQEESLHHKFHLN